MSNLQSPLLLSGVLLAALAAAVQAADSAPTDKVKGRAPVASSVTISNQTNAAHPNPLTGELLSANHSYTDADTDTESGTQWQWLRDGLIIPSAAASTYRVTATDINANLTVQVTPKSAAPADPDTGSAVVSAAVQGLSGTGAFTMPDHIGRTWAQADVYCTDLGARLPATNELESLFMQATSSPTFAPNPGYTANTEMCSIHGWPLGGGQCGGSSNSYWTGTPYSPDFHYGSYLYSGQVYPVSDSETLHVTCVR